MGVFDKFRFVGKEKPRFKYFPNRNQQQTRGIVWVAFAAFGGMGWLLIKAFESNEARLRNRYEATMENARNATIDGQTKEYHQITSKAIRRSLGFPEKPRGNVEIRDPQEERR